MKRILVICLLIGSPLALADDVIEVDIHGMTCGFCVDAVQRNLRKLPNVARVEVSLESKKVRIQTTGAGADMARIKQTIVDSGFTPVAVRKLAHD